MFKKIILVKRKNEGSDYSRKEIVKHIYQKL